MPTIIGWIYGSGFRCSRCAFERFGDTLHCVPQPVDDAGNIPQPVYSAKHMDGFECECKACGAKVCIQKVDYSTAP